MDELSGSGVSRPRGLARPASFSIRRPSCERRLAFEGEKTVVNAAQIKNEIRKLSRTDKIEIYRWIDDEVAADLSRIGANRSLVIRHEIEQKFSETIRNFGTQGHEQPPRL